MRRRRLLPVLAGAVYGAYGAGSTAGCAAPYRSGSGRPGDPIVLTLLSHYASEPLRSAMQRAVDAWNTQHERVKVVAMAVRFQDLLTTIMVRQAAGRGADIIHPYCLWVGQLVRAGVLRPAPPATAARIRHGFTRPVVASASVGGQVIGYPTEVQAYALYCNRRLLRAAGRHEPPRTWEEMEEAAYGAARRDRHGNTLLQGLALSRTDDSTVVNQTLALLASHGGSFLSQDARRTTIDSPAGRAVLDLEHRLITGGASDPGTDVMKAFPAGRVAMAISANWWTGSLRTTMGRAYRDVQVVPLPGPAPGNRGTLTTGFLMGVNAKSRHPRAAWEFLRWLNEEPTAAARPGAASAVTRMSALQMSVGTMTGRTADMRALAAAGGEANLAPFLDALEYATPEPNGPHAQRAKALLRKNIEEMWTGRRSVVSALRSATRQIDQELSREGTAVTARTPGTAVTARTPGTVVTARTPGTAGTRPERPGRPGRPGSAERLITPLTSRRAGAR
ncbi:extracellular solute-binding protein [Streptomyces sp. MST-110588]|uniref:extracellular solute-binding protein n=1 Tax=Streptomyces sp. MST-110588 TaxID=2833628 RepID=UPI001F5DF19C|nr:extracellular solute-binding protein [Streptomyces sp. MST-110588]UNO42907.1 extracellular solute-binding protein [Streptomyces sp. MST-110588]